MWAHLFGFMASIYGDVKSGRVRKWSAEAGRKRLYIHTQWKFSNSDCWSQWHMKYERQQHSQLFIALQERKEKKDGESSHTIYTPGQSWYYYYFFTREEGILQRARHRSGARESRAIWKRMPHPQREAGRAFSGYQCSKISAKQPLGEPICISALFSSSC